MKTIQIEVCKNEKFIANIVLEENQYNILKGIAMKSKRVWYVPTKQDKEALNYLLDLKKSIKEEWFKTLLETLGMNESIFEYC